MPIISLIAALGKGRVIGYKRHLPWDEPIEADWENLFRVTKGKKMIMGRKSYDDPHRISSEAGNYVISRNKNYKVDPNFEVVTSLEAALERCADQEEVFILGGQQIFEKALPIADKLYLTFVHELFKGDTYFPEFDYNDFEIVEKKIFKKGNKTPFPLTIIVYKRKK